MRKALLIILIGIHFGLKAQNTFPSNGNAGIGTTNPSAKLDIFSTRPNDHWLTRLNTNQSNWSGFWETSDNIRLLLRDTNGSVDVDLRPNGNSYINGGNLGIGTTNPSGKLEILKNANLSTAITIPNSGLIIRADNDGNDASLRFGVDNTNLKALIQTQQTTTAAKFDLLINPFGGNLGIGTSDTNGWKLAVNGKIRAKEIKVETGWSDFVFDKNYNLPTLKEVEEHINDKGHLKNIPSAKEVQENGIFLGEMDSKLLQKIEELTLYTINQEKKINKLEKENESLKILATEFQKLQKRLENLENK